MALSDYSATAASNTSIGGIDVSGAGKVKDGDNVMRQIAADIKAGVITGYTTTATAAGTTTLTVASNSYQYFTGTTTQTVVMPVTSTLELGRTWIIVNNSTGALTVNSSGSNLIATVAAGETKVVRCILLTGTTAASWHASNILAYDYGTWTPVLTFSTPGNLSVSYSTQFGSYVKIGRLVTVVFNIVTSAFTHTSASGTLQVTGLPFAADNTSGKAAMGAGFIRGYTKANFTMVAARINSNQSLVDFVASGSAQTANTLAVGDMPTGGTVNLVFTVAYEAAS